MTLNLPSSVHVKAVTYGTPRVGNAAWASLFDSKVPISLASVLRPTDLFVDRSPTSNA